MAYLGKTPSQAVRSRYYFTASGGETSLAPAQVTGLSFTDANYVDVSLNGVALVSGTDYTATPSTNTISSLSALTASDVVEIVVYDTFSVFGGNVNGDFNISGGDLTLGDNDKAIFGAGSDLQIYHDGSNSIVYEGGTGTLKLATAGGSVDIVKGSDSSETMAKFNINGAAELYHDNNKKLETTSTGVDVTGNIESTGRARASGSTGFPAFSHNTDTDTGMNPDGSGNIQFTTQGSEAMRITSAGSVGIGTSSPDATAHLEATNASLLLSNSGRSQYFRLQNQESADAFTINANDTSERMRIDSSGNVGIGKSSSITDRLHIEKSGANCLLSVARTSDGAAGRLVMQHTNAVGALQTTGSVPLTFGTNDTERMRIDSSGNVGIGTSSPNNNSGRTTLTINNASQGGAIDLEHNGTVVGKFICDGSNTLGIQADGNRDILFKTNGNSRMLLSGSGDILFGKTTSGLAEPGMVFDNEGSNNFSLAITSSNDPVLFINRQTADGTLVQFRHANTTEGSIVVSGSTVSYNGGHLARFSQATDGNRITGLVKGTVMTNLDQMAVWHHEAQAATYYTEDDELPDGVSVGDEKTPAVAAYDEDNEQLNCMAVSSVEGDANVAGVFVNWDDDDTDFTSDMNIAMTGDMVIRIAQGTTVARGDLLMSAGDGTAKPQGDDIVRSKTIAKVTSTNVSHTYDDGTYLVPCVLMAC